MQTLDIGEVATIVADWYDGTGTAAEPSTITLTIIHPDGSTDVVAKAAGTASESGAVAGTDDRWTYSFLVDAAGLWRYDTEGVVDGDDVKLPSGSFLVGVEARIGPCEPWTCWDDVLGCLPTGALDGVSSAMREAVIDEASEMLWNLSGRVYSGLCTTTRSICLACRTCWPMICSCTPVNGLDLGLRSPVWAVWDVYADGVLLDQSAYTLIDHRWLVRTDGAWPSNFGLLDPSAFRATWAYGRPVPIGGKRAAAVLAATFAQACPRECDVPENAVSIVSEGVTYVLDPAQLAQGRTGLGRVDMWLASDAKGRKRRDRIYIPGESGRLVR